MPHEQAAVTVQLGEGTVVIRRAGRSSATVANILGQEADGRGVVSKIWLDRLVHRAHETEFIDWLVCGAVVTELTRKVAG